MTPTTHEPPQLLKPTTDPTVFDLEFDNSSLELFTTCARRAQMYSIERREPAKSNAALFFGTVIHSALEVRKRQLPNWPAEQIRIVTKAFDENPTAFEEWRTAEQAMKVLGQYNFQYPIDQEPFKVIPEWIEKGFRVWLGKIELNDTLQTPLGPIYVTTLNIYYTGRVDAAIEIYGTVFAMDHKTASITGESYYTDFELSSQMIGYTWALRESGLPCTGLLADVLESRKTSKTGKEIVLRRQPYWYHDFHINEWKRDTFTLIINFVEMWRANYFPKMIKWCHAKFGECPYWNVCTQTSEEARRALLDNPDFFKHVEWSPLNAR